MPPSHQTKTLGGQSQSADDVLPDEQDNVQPLQDDDLNEDIPVEQIQHGLVVDQQENGLNVLLHILHDDDHTVEPLHNEWFDVVVDIIHNNDRNEIIEIGYNEMEIINNDIAEERRHHYLNDDVNDDFEPLLQDNDFNVADYILQGEQDNVQPLQDNDDNENIRIEQAQHGFLEDEQENGFNVVLDNLHHEQDDRNEVTQISDDEMQITNHEMDVADDDVVTIDDGEIIEGASRGCIVRDVGSYF